MPWDLLKDVALYLVLPLLGGIIAKRTKSSDRWNKVKEIVEQAWTAVELVASKTKLDSSEKWKQFEELFSKFLKDAGLGKSSTKEMKLVKAFVEKLSMVDKLRKKGSK